MERWRERERAREREKGRERVREGKRDGWAPRFPQQKVFPPSLLIPIYVFECY